MRVLVTGAAGFIGSHLAEQLSVAGYDVVAADNLSGYYDRSLKKENIRHLKARNVVTRSIDLATDDIPADFASAEIVCHLAAQPGISARVTFDEYIRNNLVATQRLAAACQSAGTTRCFIYCSTSSVYGRAADGTEEAVPAPISTYGVTKLAAEQYVMSLNREHRFPCCSLRLFSVYGPRERPDKLLAKLLGSLIEGTPFPLCEGSELHRRSFTYVSDVVDAFLLSIQNIDSVVGEIFNIGNDQETSVGETISIAESVVGRKAVLVPTAQRPGDQYITRARIEKARRILGYRPRTILRKGIEEEAKWLIKRSYADAKPGAEALMYTEPSTV
jgi:nucleoside-diphosphate-sugar epimerase